MKVEQSRVRFGAQEWLALAAILVSVIGGMLWLSHQNAETRVSVERRMTSVEVRLDVVQNEVARIRDSNK